MTLNQTWKNCLRMWKWIDKTWKPGMNVLNLKREWLKKWMPDLDLICDCFFCKYQVDEANPGGYKCSSCPGRLVSSRFHCCNITYVYRDKPKKFYQKLLQLDVKRRQ